MIMRICCICKMQIKVYCMICLVRNRTKFYKRTLVDVWGHSLTYRKPTREVKFVRMMQREFFFRKNYYKRHFVYSFKKKIKFRRQKKLKADFVKPRYLKHYYLILRMKQLQRMQKKAVRGMETFDANFLTLLECRLFMLVHRLNLINNMFVIKQVIDHGVFCINGIVKYNPNVHAKVGDFITVNKPYLQAVEDDMLLRFRQNIPY
jgi:ribosomal protein S4